MTCRFDDSSDGILPSSPSLIAASLLVTSCQALSRLVTSCHIVSLIFNPDADRFELVFPKAISVELKIMIIATVIGVDFTLVS